MDRLDHIFVVMAEEAAEVIHAIHKTLRFGPGFVNPKTGRKNIVDICTEMTELMAMLSLLEEECPPPEELDDVFYEKIISGKRERFEKYLKLSEELGRYDDAENED